MREYLMNPDHIISKRTGRRWEPAAWVTDGEKVWIKWNFKEDEQGAATYNLLRCIVACAAGNHARVVNDAYNIDRWMQVDCLYKLLEEEPTEKVAEGA